MNEGREQDEQGISDGAADITRWQHLPYIQQFGLCSLWQQGQNLSPTGSLPTARPGHACQKKTSP